jgi:hypothetical protein
MFENTLPKRIIVFPEYGTAWTGTVLRSYNHNTIAVINPDGQDSTETINVDLEYNGWASLDEPVKIPDDITNKHDYLFYQAIAKEHGL